MRKFISILTFLVIALSANAQLRYVAADSIVTWDNDVANLRNTALQASQQLRPQNIAADFTQLPKFQVAWQEEELKDVNTLSPFELSNRFMLVSRLLTLTADAHYAHEMERLIYGPLLYHAITPALTAEKIVSAQTLLTALGTMLGTRGDTVYVNFYANSTAIVNHDGRRFQLDLITAMPFHERVKIRFAQMANSKGMNFTVCLRLPEGEWNDKTFPIYCNGHDTPYRIEKGYAVITNTWRPGFEIYFDLPNPILKLD